MPNPPTKAQLREADLWFSVNTPAQKHAEFDKANVKLLNRAQLIVMLQWNDPNGDYEELSKADLITCLNSHRINADEVDPVVDARRLATMTREQLAAWYVVHVGYDPTVDDPSIETEQLRADCIDYAQESQS